MLDILRNIQIFDRTGKNVTNRIKNLKYFQVTIKSVMCLWENLEGNGYKQLYTRRLNQDSLENLFGKIRNPTTVQFVRAFKKLFNVDLLKCSDKGNCLPDMDSILVQIPPNINVYSEERKDDRIYYYRVNIHTFSFLTFCIALYFAKYLLSLHVAFYFLFCKMFWLNKAHVLNNTTVVR